jgi:hypothetical protein
MNAALREAIERETARPLPFAIDAFTTALRARFGADVAALLFYGSCRREDQPDALYDLYVLLDSYRSLPWWQRAMAACLPPNVYFLGVATAAGPRRAKCTVISRSDFRRGNAHWFHSYLWGRFCQPVSLAYCRDAQVHSDVLDCLAAAAVTFLNRIACLIDAPVDTAGLWIEGLRTSYATELRSEGPDRAAALFATYADHYATVTRAAAPQTPLTATDDGRWQAVLSPAARRRDRAAWRIRRTSGKLLALARILKAAATFEGGFDYIIWKLERHSGRTIDVPERVRRRPVLHMWGFFWQLYRAGVFR